jgi:protein SCO1
MVSVRTGIAVLLTAAVAACGQTAGQAQEYELTGQVLGVDLARQEVTIRHDDIPRFMPGMTMAFRVKEAEMLTGRVPGDLVSATLVVDGADVHLRRLERTGFAPVPADAAVPPRMLDLGEPIADAVFLDQTGASRTLADWRGQTLAVTFTYTRCPLPTFCPLIDRHFQQTQRLIQKDPALSGAARLVSVTVDPGYDRPPVLAAHAGTLGADPAVWTFLTGEPDRMRAFATQFGVSILPPASPGEVVHNLRTAIIDGEGRLVAVLGGGDWQPADLVEALRDARGRR